MLTLSFANFCSFWRRSSGLPKVNPATLLLMLVLIDLVSMKNGDLSLEVTRLSSGVEDLICWTKSSCNMAQRRRKISAINNTNAGRTRQAINRLVWFSFMRRGLCMFAPQPSQAD